MTASDNSTTEQPVRLLRIRQVMEIVPLARSTIYQEAQKGNFPKPRKLSKQCSAWVESEVQEWIDRKAAQ